MEQSGQAEMLVELKDAGTADYLRTSEKCNWALSLHAEPVEGLYMIQASLTPFPKFSAYGKIINDLRSQGRSSCCGVILFIVLPC